MMQLLLFLSAAVRAEEGRTFVSLLKKKGGRSPVTPERIAKESVPEKNKSRPKVKKEVGKGRE